MPKCGMGLLHPLRGGAVPGSQMSTSLDTLSDKMTVLKGEGLSLMSYLVDFDPAAVARTGADFLIIGSGIAGLFAAIQARKHGYRVILVTKEGLEDCNTEYAQGGIAAALGPGDNWEAHLEDTVAAGAGLSDREAVTVLVTEGPERVRELMELGVNFDRQEGQLAFTREGAHSAKRVLHAGGDATGQVIWEALVKKAVAVGVDLRDHVFALDLLVADGTCSGALVATPDGELLVVHAPVTILASGGAGRLYARTTNPEVATGDGLAMAFRAGCELADLEFIQFHPTVLAVGKGRAFLISEAVRGEGGYLRDIRGRRFMPDYHPLAELAPRDVVSRAIFTEMQKAGTDHVYLDVTHLDRDYLKDRFPTIYRTCLELGLDMARDYLPVAPAAHYLMGGVRTDRDGASSIAGLYACGEVACTGVHGANRLASNSLLEGLVFAYRAVARGREYLEGTGGSRGEVPAVQPGHGRVWPAGSRAGHGHTLWGRATGAAWLPLPDPGPATKRFTPATGQDDGAGEAARYVPAIMEAYAGIVRNREGLEKAMELLAGIAAPARRGFAGRNLWEGQNILTVARLVVESALMREESRGAHYRSDFPQPRPEWLAHIVWQKDRGAEVHPICSSGRK